MQPVIGHLHLPAVVDFLVKHTVLVTQAEADGRHFQSCQGIQKTGGQAAQAPVAQTGFILLFEQFVQILAGGFHRRAHPVFEFQIE